MCKLQDYSIATYYTRPTSKSGGSVIFVREKLSYRILDKVNSLAIESHFESCGVQIVELSTVIVDIYRPPSGNLHIFFEQFEILLDELGECKKVIICGDFNINLLLDSKYKTQFITLMQAYNFEATLNLPTRVTAKSKTCIDNFITNIDKALILNVSNFSIDFSDHDAQLFGLTDISVGCNNSKVHTTKWGRNFNTNSLNKFYNSVLVIDWQTVYQSDNKFMCFYDILFKHFNVAFPTKKIHIKRKNKSWISAGIRKSSKTKRQLHQLIKDYPHPVLINHYKTYCNVFQKIIKAARKNCIDEAITRSNNVTKTTWKIIKSELNKSNNHNENIKIVINDKTYNDPLIVANNFNEYFSQIAAKLHTQIPKVSGWTPPTTPTHEWLIVLLETYR